VKSVKPVLNGTGI